MKIYTKIIFDKNNKLVFEESFDYIGPLSACGIHYDFKSTRGAKAMAKQAKREKKIAERRAKRAAKEGFEKKDDKTNNSISSNVKNFVENWEDLPDGDWLPNDDNGVHWYEDKMGRYWYSTDDGYRIWEE